MKKSFISLFLLTLILSHFSILNLWAGVAQDTWIDGNPSYANQFKWYSLPAVSLPNEVVNIQQPNFDASNWGIYVSFGDADFNQIYYNGILKTNETDYKIQGAGISFRISSLTAQNTVILIKKDGNTKYGLRIYNSAVTINAAGTELLYSYADGQYTTTSGSETSCAGTLSSTDKIITGSDFYWSGKHSETVQKYDNTWTGVASNVKCCSRDELTFSASTYKISIVTKNTEGTTRKLPKVQINSVDYSVQRVIVGGESQSFSSNQWTYAGNTETTLEYDIDYSSSGSGPYHVSMVTDADGSGGDKDKYLFKSLTISSAAPACTAPSSVSVAPTSEAGNYGWRYTLGETIKLTATATGGTPSSYTYQWKKKTGASTWKDLSDGVDATDGGTFSGTTSANLEISGCTSGNAGTYKCVVSTGSECSTESNEYWVRVFSLNGNYSGNSFVANPIVWSDEYNGTATITLNANSVYEFKVTDNDTHTFGLTSPDIYKDEDNFRIYGNDVNNVALHTGKVAGIYTFTVNVYHANENNPYCDLTAVRYPKMTIYMSGGNTTWCDANPVFFAHTYGQAINDVKMTAHACESGLFYADVPSYNTKVTFTRQRPGSESIAWSGDDFWNKSKDEIVIGSNNMFTCTGWDNNEGVFSGSTFSPSTYTISFESNGSDGGSAMSNVTAIPCGEDRTLVANTWEKSGYTFTGWKTNVAISTSAGDIAADGIVPNEATIQDITQNITLTAQWAEEEGCVSRYVIECEDNAYLITPTSAAQSCPGEYIKGSDSGYWSGFNGQYIEHKNSTGNTGYTGEMYYLVNLPNTATYSFIVRTATKKNQWINIYGVSGSDGSHYVTYNNVTYKKIQDGVRAGVDNENQTFVDVNTTTVALDAGTYVIGLYGESWATWDRFIITDNTTYTVQYATGDGGGTSISAKNTDTEANIPNNSAVTKCTNVTFTAGVAAGYRVNYWTVNGVRYTDADGLSSFSMDISQDVTVRFVTTAEVSYAVTVNRNNNDYGTASADAASYSAGSTVHISATPQPGYRFVNWTTSDPISIADATSASTTFTMIASAVTVQANFAEATCMSTKTIEAESYIPDWFAYREGEGISKPTDGEFSGTSYVQFNQETEINYFVSLPAANYKFHIYHGGTGNNKYFNLYGLDDSAESDTVMYNGHIYKNTAYKGTALNEGGSRWTDQYVTCNLPANDYIIGLYGNDGSNIIYDKIVIEAYGNVDNNVFCYHSITMNTTAGTAGEATSGVARALLGDIVTISAPAASSGYHFTGWTASPSVTFTSDPSVASNSFTMPNEDVTLTANYALDELTISSLPWEGSQDLTQIVVSAAAINSCFDTEITFTFTTGTVSYYDNNDRETPLGTAVTSGTAITLNDSLRAHGIYIECTSGDATLTGVEKTTVGSVYTIWSGSVNVSADYTGVNEAGDKVTLRAEDQDWWLQQVVLGPEHFQTAAVGDTLRVTYTNIDDYAMGAIQTATKYNAIPGNIYNESDGLTVSNNTGVFDLPSSGYYHIITAGSLDSLKNKGIVVKGKGHTITRVSLHASCSNLSLRTTAPDKTTYGDDESINIMTGTLEFGDGGFDLGNWEHQVELDKSCFTNVTVGSIINLYMSVVGDATLSFRCNVPSIIADDKRGGVGCPSYGDISFDRTIDDLYGNTPSVVGETKGYKVMYLKVDADMERRLKETGMILCGKGTLIKVVEGVEDTVTVMPNENKPVPTVVNNIVIYQGGQVTNEEDIMVLGSITYIRPAEDDGEGGKLGNKLDQWYTFALPFTVSDVEVYDVEEGKWYDINAVYYLNDATDQDANDPDGAGHYYLQYLKAENETAIGRDFAARWQYITPGHSLAIDPEDWDDGTRYGYPKKDSAYIILFDSNQPSGLSGYWESNPIIRFVGGPQTIDGVAKKWQVEADGEQYWMYANNTLHSFTLTDAYILNGDGTKFVLQESPTIRPFECYVQATASLKEKCAAISMRGFRIDNTTTGAKSIQGSAIRAEKILRNGQLIIIRNGVEYDATGLVIR